MGYKRLFFLLACLYTFGLQGQGYTDIVSFGTEYFPLETGGEKFGGTRSALNVLLPVALSKEKSRYLLAGLNADAIRFADAPETFGSDRFFGFYTRRRLYRPIAERLQGDGDIHTFPERRF